MKNIVEKEKKPDYQEKKIFQLFKKMKIKKKTKNIQVIDGAYNSCYSIYSIEEKYFNLIFPNEQDIEFASDFVSRVGKKIGNQILKELWKNETDRKLINGIHGTLFDDYESCDCGEDIRKKKRYYLSKNWKEVSMGK